MSVISVTDETFSSEVEEEAGVVFVDFWAEWCGPCKSLAPHYEQMSTQYPAKFTKANLSEAEDVAKGLGIRSIPTIIAFRGGTEVARHIGSQLVEDFIATHAK